MEISIASLSASPLFIKHAEKIFDGEERARETLRAYDNLVCHLPKMFMVINKDTDGTAIHFCKMAVGMLQQFRCLMQCCIDSGCSMAELWERKQTGTQHCTPCNYRTMFVETCKTICAWLPSYCQGIQKRAEDASRLNDSSNHHSAMLLEVDCLLEKKVFCDTAPVPRNLYG